MEEVFYVQSFQKPLTEGTGASEAGLIPHDQAIGYSRSNRFKLQQTPSSELTLVRGARPDSNETLTKLSTVQSGRTSLREQSTSTGSRPPVQTTGLGLKINKVWFLLVVS